MAIKYIGTDPITQASYFTGLSTDNPNDSNVPYGQPLIAGSLIYDSDTPGIRQYSGTTWVTISTGGAMTVSLSGSAVTIVGTSQPGIARNRQVVFSSSSATSVTWLSPGVKGIVIDSVHVTGGAPSLSGSDNFRVRYAVDAANNAAADLLLPNAFNNSASDVDIGQVGSFNLQQHYVPDTEAAGDLRVARLTMEPHTINVSEPIRRLDFIHNITGVTLAFIILAVEEV